MDDTRCKYINKTCPHARSVKENGELHRLCTFHRAKAVDAQRRWHSRRRSGVKRRSHTNHDDDDGGDTDASSTHAYGHAPHDVYTHPPPPPSPKRRHVSQVGHSAPELPALAEVMMMLRQRRPVADTMVPPPPPPPPSYERMGAGEAPWATPGHANQDPRYYEEPHPPPTAVPVQVRSQPRYYAENAPRQPYYEPERYEHVRYEHGGYERSGYERGGYERGGYTDDAMGARPSSRTSTSPANGVRPLHAYTRDYRANGDDREYVRSHDRSDQAAGHR